MTTNSRLIKAEKSGSSGRIPELDGLRGLAIGMVLVWHYFALTIDATPGTPFSYLLVFGRLTWTGVDLFFVLSGFLIGGILYDARNATNYFKVFYTRRFFRIVPIYAAILIVLPLLLYSTRFSRWDFAWLVKDSLPALSYWTFTQNFWMAAAGNLGAAGLAVTWSLAIEEQFYLTLPLVMRLVTGRWLVVAVLSGIAVAPVVRTAATIFWPHNWVIGFAMMPCRADALLLGVLAALIVRNESWKRRVETNRKSLLFALGILGSAAALLAWKSPSLSSPLMQRYGYSCVASFYCVILLYALTNQASPISRFLRVGWLRWLGGIAYGAYLMHQIALDLVFGYVWGHKPRVDSISSLFATVCALAATLFIARMSWRYFERPLIQFGHRSDYAVDSAQSERVAYPEANVVTP